jgi:ribosome-associated heat shock protein Hsp15
MAGIRIDKWLWAARFFKTRSLATAACDTGHVQCNGQAAKPSRMLKLGDELEVRNEGEVYTVELLELSEVRGSAAIAGTLYRESDASRELRVKVAEERKAMLIAEPSFARAKPSKRDRRLIHSFRGH